MTRRTRKQVRADRQWKHWLYWLSPTPFTKGLRPLENYGPEPFRDAFNRFQSSGASTLTPEELDGIHPLVCAQKAKEVFLTSLAEESMEWWSKGDGWIYPWLHTLAERKNGEKPMDRLTLVAILRTMKSIQQDSLGFFLRHPGIKESLRQKYLATRLASV